MFRVPTVVRVLMNLIARDLLNTEQGVEVTTFNVWPLRLQRLDSIFIVLAGRAFQDGQLIYDLADAG